MPRGGRIIVFFLRLNLVFFRPDAPGVRRPGRPEPAPRRTTDAGSRRRLPGGGARLAAAAAALGRRRRAGARDRGHDQAEEAAVAAPVRVGEPDRAGRAANLISWFEGNTFPFFL